MKSTRGALGGLTRHYERAKTEDGEFLKFGNQEIDTNKTHLNYNLASDNFNQLEFIKKRTGEVKCLNRKDVNVMCSWVITKPENIAAAEEKEFFRESYNFLKDQYGEENIISAYVHNDETTPHLHFAFVPVILDKEKNTYKVSAKEVLTRGHLQKFHSNLDNHMQRTFKRDIGILNLATREGNRSIEELKKGTATEKLNSLEKDIEDKQVVLNSAENDLKACRQELKITRVSKADIVEINEIEAFSGLFNKDKVNISKKDYEKLKSVAKMARIKKESIANPYLEIIKKLENTNKTLVDQNKEKEKEIGRLIEKNKPKFTFAEITAKAKEKSKTASMESRIEKLERFIKDKDLVSEFNNQKNKSISTHQR